MAKGDSITVTPDTTVAAILEDLPGAAAVLREHFGPGVTMPGQTWVDEPLAKACMLRGVDEKKLLTALRKLTPKG